MKDLIQEGRKIQETFKKNVIVEDNSLSKFFGKKSSGISKYGKWDYSEFNKSKDMKFYVANLQASNNFISKINSNPEIKLILETLGKVEESHAIVEGPVSKLSFDIIVKFQKLEISFSGESGMNNADIISIKRNSVRDVVPFALNNKIHPNKLRGKLVEVGGILSSELQKEWKAKIWEKPEVMDSIDKYYRKIYPNPDFSPVFP